jgi:endonuclease/exonuclease/phosphatase family metal-dependent hydrolase
MVWLAAGTSAMSDSVSLRIVTYNIHKCRGFDGRVSPSRIARILTEVNADIIALQEVLDGPGHFHSRQSEFIASELGMHSCFGSNRQIRGGNYGNAILSRFPIEDYANYDISVAGREPRGCLRADVSIQGQRIHLFNVHLGTSYKERRQQASILCSPGLLLNPSWKGSRVVLGDFNEWTRGLATRLLTQHFLGIKIEKTISFLQTYPGFFPFLHLDHIYFESGLHLISTRLHRSRRALIASDHLPIVAEFVMQNMTQLQE